MSGEALEFFTEFIYGSGSWLFIILVICLVALTAYNVKRSSLLFFPVLALLGLSYIEYSPNTLSLTWGAIVLWVCIPLTLFIDYKGN